MPYNDPNSYYRPPFYGYAPPRPAAKNTQPLTQEQINELRQDSDSFNMKIDRKDILKSSCCHREKNGQSTLMINADNTYTCSICHETFSIYNGSKEELAECIRTLSDALQTIKVMYVNAPEQLISQFMQILELLKKVIPLWEHASKCFATFENPQSPVVPYGPGFGGSYFNTLNNLIYNNPYNQGMYYQPQPGQPYYAPNPAYAGNGANGYNGTQTGYPNYYQGQYTTAQPAPGMMWPGTVDAGNPMGYNAPAPAAQPQPQAPAPGMMPGLPTNPPTMAPQAPNGGNPVEVTQQKTFDV